MTNFKNQRRNMSLSRPHRPRRPLAALVAISKSVTVIPATTASGAVRSLDWLNGNRHHSSGGTALGQSGPLLCSARHPGHECKTGFKITTGALCR